MIKIIHAADFHLDSPLGGLPNEKATARREELRGAVSKIVDIANENEVDVLLLSGDLFDSTDYYSETAQRISCDLARANPRVFIAPGNHDFFSVSGAYNQINWPENVHIFKSSDIKSVVIPELDLTVYGAAFVSPHCDFSMLRGFTAEYPDKPSIMVMHGEVSEHSRYNPISEHDISASGLSYLALGHNHTFSGIKKTGNTYYASPGCPEGRGFDEAGDKGIIIGALTETGNDFAFVPICRRKYEIVNVDLTNQKSPKHTILRAVPPNRKLILRVILEGEFDPDALRLSELTHELENSYYYISLRDHTRMKRDIWEQRSENTLKGLFLSAMYEKFTAAPDSGEKKLIERAVIYGLAALSNGEAPGI